MIKIHWRGVLFFTALSIGTWHGFANTIPIQQWMTDGLLHTAWVRTKANGHSIQPLPWTSTSLIARVSIPRLNIDQVVLANSNDSLGHFALQHLSNSTLPGEQGNSVMTVPPSEFYSFLSELRDGDMLIVESLWSGRTHYQVAEIRIVGKTDITSLQPTSNRRLTLVSCYQCNNDSSEWRYVVIAEGVDKS